MNSTDTKSPPSSGDIYVSFLCLLALQHPSARVLIRENHACLDEVERFLPEAGLLRRIAEHEGTAVDVLALLADEDRAVIANDVVIDFNLETQAEVAEAVLHAIRHRALLRRNTAVLSALGKPGLSMDQMKPLLQEAKELSEALKAMGPMRWVPLRERATSSHE